MTACAASPRQNAIPRSHGYTHSQGMFPANREPLDAQVSLPAGPWGCKRLPPAGAGAHLKKPEAVHLAAPHAGDVAMTTSYALDERVNNHRSGSSDIIFLADDEDYISGDDADAQEIDRSELAQKILNSIITLSKKQRRVWEYVLDGYSQAEIARKTGVSVQAISKTITSTRNYVRFHAEIVIKRESLAGNERLPMRDNSCPPPLHDGVMGQLSLFGGEL